MSFDGRLMLWFLFCNVMPVNLAVCFKSTQETVNFLSLLFFRPTYNHIHIYMYMYIHYVVVMLLLAERRQILTSHLFEFLIDYFTMRDGVFKETPAFFASLVFDFYRRDLRP